MQPISDTLYGNVLIVHQWLSKVDVGESAMVATVILRLRNLSR